MTPRLVELVPEVQFMFVGATTGKMTRLKRLGMLDRCVMPEVTIDDERLATYDAACDVFVTAAETGESQGVALGEALACGVPVVTCSTPWADNAQIEFVDHGRNGYVANHPRTFAEATADLLLDDRRRASFGAAARPTAEAALDAGRLARQLDGLYESLLSGAAAPERWSPSPSEVDAFHVEYERRLKREYSTLSLRERIEMRRLRAEEHAREAARHVRAHVGYAGNRLRAQLRAT
jgi:hypothetical protein